MRPARAVAAAKINLALVVGPRRDDGLHEVATVLQRLDVCDRIELAPADVLAVEGFRDDTIVARALALLAGEAGIEPAWRVRIAKEIPVAAGLGGGSADAAAALRLANATLPAPLDPDRLHAVAAAVGADVPFFLEPGPKLAQGTGELLAPLDLPQDFWIVVALARGVTKASTGEVYARYDALGGGPGFAARRDELRRLLGEVRRAEDLALLPANDLAEASGAGALVSALRSGGAFRADVSGAGAAVYGLFLSRADARSAARGLGRRARVWVAIPVW
jgi:4-diphosphocytidyl-2-C-methyl-D-erythritol kinase